MTESKIIHGAGGTVFTGDAVHVFQAAALRSGLRLMAQGIKPHRSWTSLAAALNKATEYTGQPYSGRKDIDRACIDLTNWVIAKKAEYET